MVQKIYINMLDRNRPHIDFVTKTAALCIFTAEPGDAHINIIVQPEPSVTSWSMAPYVRRSHFLTQPCNPPGYRSSCTRPPRTTGDRHGPGDLRTPRIDAPSAYKKIRQKGAAHPVPGNPQPHRGPPFFRHQPRGGGRQGSQT